MASTCNHGKTWQAGPISRGLSPPKDHVRPKYACGPLDKVHPFLTNGKCIEGRHVSVRTKLSNLRESKSRNLRDLHLEAIQREKSSRKLASMPALQLRVSSGNSSLLKLRKRNRSSILFFGKADQSVDTPSPTSPSDQLPPLYKLDTSSFLDLFQSETRHLSSSSGPSYRKANAMPDLSITPVESPVRVESSSYLSPVSPITSEIQHPWSPDDAYTNILQPPNDSTANGTAAARSPSASSRSSAPQDNGNYFSSVSQSSHSSLEGDTLPKPRAIRDTSPKYMVEPKEQACDLEVVQTNAKRSHAGRRVYSESLHMDKPLPPQPLVDIASPLFEIACPAVGRAPSNRFSAQPTNCPDNFRPRRSSSASKKNRPSSPKSSKLSRGEKLGMALTLHAQGVKIPHIVRHELPSHPIEAGEQSPESGNTSPISKLISELESSATHVPRPSRTGEGNPAPKFSIQASSRGMKESTMMTVHKADQLGSDAAEKILLNILSLLDIHDLLSAARISRGFFNVFRNHELSLTKSAIFNMSAAAWEHLEEPGKSSRVPATYLHSYRNGLKTIASLRSTLLIRCDGLLRPDTVAGLIRADKEKSKNIDEAFWRIWTFCEVFGYRSSRWANIQAQVDWLQSGRAGQNRASNSSATKKNWPLSAAELLDINEMWTCLASLLQGFHNQATEARDVGLFERCKIDDDHNEEFYIKQWTAHVMTFGLSAIMELSTCSFEDARSSGLTRWSPAALTDKEPMFLTDAVASVYQRRLIEEAESEATKVVLPRKASGRTQSGRKRHPAHGDVLRLQTQNLPRKAVGSPGKKSSIPQPHQPSSTQASQNDLCFPAREGSQSASTAAAPQRAARRRSAASPAITAAMFQTLSLQPGASTQIGPTLFPSLPPSARSLSNSAQPRPMTPLSLIQSTPIAVTRPERVPLRSPDSAILSEQPYRGPPAPPLQTVSGLARPVVNPIDEATNLLVNDMGFPAAAVKNALASCDTGSHFDLEVVIAMLVSANSEPATSPAANPTTKLVPTTDLNSPPIRGSQYAQRQTRAPCPEARLSMRKKQDKHTPSAQNKLVEFVERTRSREQKDGQRRQSKKNPFQVFGVAQDRRVSTWVG